MGFGEKSRAVVGLLFVVVALFSLMGGQAKEAKAIAEDSNAAAPDKGEADGAEAASDMQELAEQVTRAADFLNEPIHPLAKSLKDAQIATGQLGKDVKKAKAMNLAFMGLGAGGAAGAGLALLGALSHVRSADPLSRGYKALGVGSSALALLSIVGATVAYLQKQKAEQKDKNQLVDLLKIREKMINDLSDGVATENGSDETTKKLELYTQNALENIADAAEKFGVYHQAQN